jgi:SPP1 family predicted phage head-tail adaptor
MQVGRRDRRITLQRQQQGVDSYNRPVTQWVPIGTRWASWRRATANEQWAGGQVNAQVTDIFEIRHDSTVAALSPKDRLIYGSRTYDLVEVTEIGRREGLLIRAVARADA